VKLMMKMDALINRSHPNIGAGLCQMTIDGDSSTIANWRDGFRAYRR